jgi:bacillolysin
VNTPCTAQTKYSSTLNITGDLYSGGYRLRESRNSVTIQTLNLSGLGSSYTLATDFTNTNTNWTSTSWSSFNQNQQALDAHWAQKWCWIFGEQFLAGIVLMAMGWLF